MSLFWIKNTNKHLKLTILGFNFNINKKKVFIKPKVLKKKDIEFFKTEHHPKEILIIKTDSLGDYILMRNFLKEIKSSPKYKDAKIHMILSSCMKNVATYLDSDIIDQFFFVPHPFWMKNRGFYKKCLNNLFKQGLKKQYDAILFPNFNRYVFNDFNQLIVENIFAKESILNQGDRYIGSYDDEPQSNIFSRTVDSVGQLSSFEFDNNKHFFEQVLDVKIDKKLPVIEKEKLDSSYIKPFERYIVLNPCTQDEFREWHLHNWANLVKYYKDILELEVILICDKKGFDVCKNIKKLADRDVSIYVQRPFSELFSLMSNAELFVGGDSGFFHIAVALGVKALAISCGVSFVRFMNYPQSDNYRILITKNALKYIKTKKDEDLYKFFNFNVGINTITVEEVKEASEELIKGS